MPKASLGSITFLVSANADGCAPNKSCPDCAGDLLNAFDVIASVRYGPEWNTNFGMPATNIFDDITGGTLPAVSWVIPEDNEDDHPGERVDKGPSWVASVVNALGESSYWDSTAIFIVWDDWGGFYDNAVPQQFNDNLGGLGFRVPASSFRLRDRRTVEPGRLHLTHAIRVRQPATLH